MIDDEEDFKVTLGGSKAKGKKGGKEEGGAAKRKRARARIMDSGTKVNLMISRNFVLCDVMNCFFQILKRKLQTRR